MKISILGAGRVGSTLAYTIVLKQLCEHLVIASRDERKALGDALDLQHALSFFARPMTIEACALEAVADSDIVVITCSVPADARFTSRMQLGPGNVALFRQLIPGIAVRNPEALLVVITNPVDVMTLHATRLSGFSPDRVMGVGTLVDSARFRTLLSQREHIHPDDLRAYVLGEHGPSQFPVLGNAQAGGEPIRDSPEHRDVLRQVTDAGFQVYRLKGYTNYAIAAATCLVLEAIVFDEHRTIPLATYFDEWIGIRENCFSIPVVVGRKGIIRHLRPRLNRRERRQLESAAAAVKQAIRSLLGDVGIAPTPST